MSTTTKCTWLIAFALSCSSVSSATLAPAYVFTEAGIVAPAGKFLGCELKVAFVEQREKGSRDVLSVALILLHTTDTSVIKASLGQTDQSSKPQKNVELSSIWIRIGGGDGVLLTESRPGDDLSLLGRGGFNDTLKLMSAIMQDSGKKQIQVGYQRKSSVEEKILSGTTAVSNNKRIQLASCFDELAEKVRF